MYYGLGDYKSPGLIGRTFFTTDFKSVGTPSGVWDGWRALAYQQVYPPPKRLAGDERHIRRDGIVLLSNRGKFYGFSNFCIFSWSFQKKS